MLLHHPFESFEPVVQFLREAVHDPDVLAIKQTIYRTGSESVLMDLLIEAARRGKEVMAVVELKARFDEEANINWAERLEAVGAQVVYGIVGLKTHAKLLLVTRREAARAAGAAPLRAPVHRQLQPDSTARLYTDIGYLTADPDLTADADARVPAAREPDARSAAAPPADGAVPLHRQMLRTSSRSRDAARAGQPARIVAKVNALTDVALIEALVAAGAGRRRASTSSCAAPACCRRAAGRHRAASACARSSAASSSTRGCSTSAGATATTTRRCTCRSADWMGRNMFRRIEVAWPVRDARLRQRVIDECLVPYLHDARDAWSLASDGSYEPRRRPTAPARSRR